MAKRKKSCTQCGDSFTEMELSADALRLGSPQAAQAFTSAMAAMNGAASRTSPVSLPKLPAKSQPPQATTHMSRLPRVSRLEERGRGKSGCVYLDDQVVATPGGTFKVI